MRSLTKKVLVGATLALVPAMGFAAEPTLGEREYRANCAVCHGVKGDGKGSFAGMLTVAPSDLSMLAKSNGGVFPFDRIYKVIDGRAPDAGHGGGEMPIWGNRYSVKAGEYYMDSFATYNPEEFVRARILALIDHLNALQRK